MNYSEAEPHPSCDIVDVLLDDLGTGTIRLARMITTRYSTGSRPGEIGLPQYLLLQTLRDGGPMRVSDMADSCDMKNPAVSMALQGLEDKGYITREHDAQDRRVVRVSLTDAGLSRLSDSEHQRREIMRRYTSALSIEDLRTLVRIQNTLIDTVSTEHD